MKSRDKSFRPRLAAAAALATQIVAGVALGGCAKDIEARGNLPNPEALARLTPGEQTRDDVETILGTPATTAIFDNENWYYISAHTTQYAFYPNHELDRTVYVVSFDPRGILSGVRKLSLDDGQSVSIQERETITKGREISLIEQLLGNIGRIGNAPGSGPGGPNGPPR